MKQSKRTKIALIAFYNHNSSSVRILHSILREHGYDVHSLFIKHTFSLAGTVPGVTNKEKELLIQTLKEIKPSVVGISVLSSIVVPFMSKITKEIKSEIDTNVVWGGIHPSLAPEECLEHADMVCIGEGEGSMLELADVLEKGGDVSSIQNIWTKQDGIILKNSLRPLIKNLDDIPFPDFTDDNKYYIVNDKLSRSRVRPLTYYDLMSIRGCPFHCTYCSTFDIKSLYPGQKYVRRRSVKNVINELMYIKKNFKCMRRVQFRDDVFAMDESWLKEFCKEYKEKINIPFFCYPHPKITDENIISMLSDAGLFLTKIGLQSGSDYIRNKVFKRPEAKEEIIKLGKLMNKHKVRVIYDLISANPFETEEDKRATLDVLFELPKPFQVYVHKLCFFPDAAITQEAIKRKQEIEQDRYMRMLPLDIKEDSDKVFWCSIYYMTGKRYIPNFIVKKLSYNTFLRKYPYFLAFFIDVMHRLYEFLLVVFKRV